YYLTQFICAHYLCFQLFFYNDASTTEIFTLSLHDALPIFIPWSDYNASRTLSRLLDKGIWVKSSQQPFKSPTEAGDKDFGYGSLDRKSTRLNSSHVKISYAVFCMKKKNMLFNFLLITNESL